MDPKPWLAKMLDFGNIFFLQVQKKMLLLHQINNLNVWYILGCVLFSIFGGKQVVQPLLSCIYVYVYK